MITHAIAKYSAHFRIASAVVAAALITTLAHSRALAQSACDTNCDAIYNYDGPPIGVVPPIEWDSSVAPEAVITPDAPITSVAPSPTAPTAAAPFVAPPYVAPPSAIPSRGNISSGFATGGASATAGIVAPGYIDHAGIMSRVRIRYDNMAGANAPTRAEFLYPTIGDRGGRGPALLGGLLNQEFDFDELSTYVELAFFPRFSIFGEAPLRRVHPLDLTPGGGTDAEASQVGAGDLRGGLRLGLIANKTDLLTLQVLYSARFGDARKALGVGHNSIDVALLAQKELSDNLTFFAELHDWQTINSATLDGDSNNGDFAEDSLDANVMRYGAGIGVDLWERNRCRSNERLTGLFEVVGWTVLDGLETPLNDNATPITRDASGDTIVNGKYGFRYTRNSNSFYVGYGHNWTSDRWYSDLFRLEMSHFF